MRRKKTVKVAIGSIHVGGDAPIIVQAMTNTNTEDIDATVTQCRELAEAGAEMIRFTVNTPRAAAAVPEISKRLKDCGVTVPLIGDFHYNGHKLLREFPQCAETLDKYRINPGNVGKGDQKAEHFAEICRIAVDLNKAIRIGVNAGSLDEEMVKAMLDSNARAPEPKPAQSIINVCMLLSALESAEYALSLGVKKSKLVLSCKTSQPRDLIFLYRELSKQTHQPLHLGLTEAGMGLKGITWSAAAMAILLEEGIGDTIRVSLTPMPGTTRADEVYAAQQLLQALELRHFTPVITACPGCGRTSNDDFQWLAAETERYVRKRLPDWKKVYSGVENLNIAVMGCIVNGPGESRAANIGISLPGNQENPSCPVYVNGLKVASLSGSKEEIRNQFVAIIENYVSSRLILEKEK